MAPTPNATMALCAAVVVGAGEIDLSRLIHIPKTGGSSIEQSLKKRRGVETGRYLALGAAGGMFRELLALPPAPCSGTEHGWCSTWHTPPQACVPRSYCVVREPYERLLSELGHRLHFFRAEEMRSEHGNVTAAACHSCGALEAWARRVLAREAEQPGAQDCHLVPQWAFARRCAALAPLDALPELLQRHMQIRSPIRAKASRRRCLGPEACPAVRELVARAYARDARLYAHVRALSGRCAAPGARWAFVGRAHGGAAAGAGGDDELARVLDGGSLGRAAHAAGSAAHAAEGDEPRASSGVDVLSDTRAYDAARARARPSGDRRPHKQRQEAVSAQCARVLADEPRRSEAAAGACAPPASR